ncbi:histone-lysine N-methyltransferase SUV39H2-like [Ruditapes philippinarum]|uniref:histone-lysine N-methyltransferase SUV39H2-like n=1 Tax=Ruditapes philippinarum TaxID=129788 RepID=UPI00295AD84D|nr:histone-lysine N-methyltransferase SUV39H2-like [Ruditapes philippinarum]
MSTFRENFDRYVSLLNGLKSPESLSKIENFPSDAFFTNFFLLENTSNDEQDTELVEKGEITWENDEDFEVEQIVDYVEEDGVEFYLIKWKGWSHAHNSWEPKDNLDCPLLMEEFHTKNNNGNVLHRASSKRKYDEIKESKEDEREMKRTRVDELFHKLVSCKEVLTPLQLISLTSPDKGKPKSYRGLVSCEGLKVPKFNNASKYLLNPRTKAYKRKKVQILEALKDWEKHLNAVSTDPAPISVENEVDLEGPPENFEYINDYKAGRGIVIPNDPVIGCECSDCFGEKSQCCAVQFGVEFAYFKWKRLRIHAGRPIYECNKKCKCGPECSNRVVQHGRKHKVCIFRTKNCRGWGVKAMQKIKAGTFVMEYVGEVISSEEAEVRGKTYDSVGRTYLFDLDFNGDDCPFTVDAAVYGNVSHFVNHSCDPNLEVYSVWINTLDPRLPRIALFSRRDIEKGEELTFDYMSSKVHSPLEESLEGESIAVDLNADDRSEAHLEMKEVQNGDIGGDLQNNKLLIGDINGDGAVESLPTEKGDSKNTPKSSPQKSQGQQGQQTDPYRMVCQCGAKNCRKFVF